MDKISFDARPNQVAPATPSSLPTADLARNRELVQAVQAVSRSDLFGDGMELTFALDRATRRLVVRLKDSRTGETVRQIPPEYVLRLAANLKTGHHPRLE